MRYDTSRPLVFLSVFKSGTHAVRWMLEALTGLPYHEPPITPGRVNYSDPGQLVLTPGHYYSWHLVPEATVCTRLRELDARPVFLVRHIGELAISMYHHFADNIDADIGRGRNVAHHFAALSTGEGLMGIVQGLVRPDFRWRGIGPHLRQIELMFQFSTEYPCFVTSHARITGAAKRAEVERLAEFLDVDVSGEAVDHIVAESSFERMKARARAAGQASHYRRGSGGEHDMLSTEHHRALWTELRTWAPELPRLCARLGFVEILTGVGESP